MENEETDRRDESPSAKAPRSGSRGGKLLAVVLGAMAGAGGVYLAMRARPATPIFSAPPGTEIGPTAPGSQAGPIATPLAVKVASRKIPQKAIYRCPMHPAITSDHPGSCPICGMTLVLDVDSAPEGPSSGAGAGASASAGVTARGVATAPAESRGSVEGLAAVTIDSSRQQMIGLRTSRAERAVMADTWRTVGRVEIDPTRVRRVNVKVEGYVDRVFVDFVGKPVRKGQPLISVFSPDLLAAQEEYLLALKTRRQLGEAGMPGSAGDDLVAASRRRLELWDVPPETLDRLVRTGVASKTLTLLSPLSGVVTAKNVVEGATLRPGDVLYEITDLRMVWVMADAYESDIARVRVGMPATLSLPAYPNRPFQGRVEFIDPVVDPGSRTAKVHLHFANPSGLLKPEMFGEVVFRGAPRTALRIPADALIRTGSKDVVFVALGAGRFAPREVHLGPRDGELVAVQSGLREGEEVVTRANFLVDSESRLRASLAALAGK